MCFAPSLSQLSRLRAYVYFNVFNIKKMSRFMFSSFSEDEFCNESLNMSPEGEWGVWCDNDNFEAFSLNTCQQRVRCAQPKPGPQPPPPPLITAQCPTTLPCVAPVPEACISATISSGSGYTTTLSRPNSALSHKELSPASQFSSSSPAYIYDYSQNNSLTFSSSIPSDLCNNNFGNVELNDYNFEDFAQDVTVSYRDYINPQPAVLAPEESSFLDNLILSAREEISKEGEAPQIESACSPSPSVSSTKTDTLILTPEHPLTIIGEDGNEYKVVLQPVAKPSSTIKRKSSSSSITGPAPKRAPGVSLAEFTEDEINERKKEQNRVAARRYRDKMRETRDSEKDEKSRLCSRNEYLKEEASRLEKEIATLKSLMFNAVH
ncbi:unnamed protein product [Auanema sp. JU1783]|nr:unnamed protein product [Auanema sp. JU1783]